MTRSRRRLRGTVLLAVLIVSMLSSMVVVSLLHLVRAEHMASAGSRGGEQAWEAAMSGVHHAALVALRFAETPETWEDNPDLFRHQLVEDDGVESWHFTVYAPAAGGGIRFGMTDESSKLNVNAFGEDVLAKLPNVGSAMADSLLDYLDGDGEPRLDGAEQDTYDALEPPYRIRNGEAATFDELLLVRGFNAGHLYGEDANFNFQLDPAEDDGDESFPPDDSDGELDRGLFDYLTVWSAVWELDRLERPRIDLNGDLEPLKGLGLPTSTSAFLEAARLAGDTFAHPSELFEAQGVFEDAGGNEVRLDSGVDAEALSVLLDRTTVHTAPRRVAAHVNVNSAAADVLALVPGLDESLAEAIVARRGDLEPEARRTIAWLVSEGILEGEHFKKVAPYLVARSYQFHLRVIGYGIPSGRYRILDVVLDVGYPQPRVLYLRDLTRHGPPFALRSLQETFDRA